ncbi:MAG: hypothetical protein Q4D98_09245 [Planctomycetia bacterium]|nr:hypothetical protein [Planctomycetia bacterium]
MAVLLWGLTSALLSAEPALRLLIVDQDGSSGAGTHTWSQNGNPDDFRIMTAGSTVAGYTYTCSTNPDVSYTMEDFILSADTPDGLYVQANSTLRGYRNSVTGNATLSQPLWLGYDLTLVDGTENTYEFKPSTTVLPESASLTDFASQKGYVAVLGLKAKVTTIEELHLGGNARIVHFGGVSEDTVFELAGNIYVEGDNNAFYGNTIYGTVGDRSLNITANIYGSADKTLIVTGFSENTSNYLQLSGDNTNYHGNWDIEGSNFYLANAVNSLGTGDVALNSYQMTNGGDTFTVHSTLIFGENADQFDHVAFSNNVTGEGRVFKVGTSTMIMSGEKTYTGDTHIVAGTLELQTSLSSETLYVGPAASLNITNVVPVDATTVQGYTLENLTLYTGSYLNLTITDANALPTIINGNITLTDDSTDLKSMFGEGGSQADLLSKLGLSLSSDVLDVNHKVHITLTYTGLDAEELVLELFQSEDTQGLLSMQEALELDQEMLDDGWTTEVQGNKLVAKKSGKDPDPKPPVPPATAEVPEPGTFVLFLFGIFLLFRRGNTNGRVK